MAVLLGVDIGGTKIAAGLIDGESGVLLATKRTPTEAASGGERVLERAIELAGQLVSESAMIPTAIGVGAGGQIDPIRGTVINATEILPGWKGQRLKDTFESAFSLPTSCDNDVNALAIGESHFGAGREFTHLAFLALGTGVGGALIHQNRLIHGPHGAGGELGHLILYPDAPEYLNGTRGCLEQFTSGPAIKERYVAAGGDANISGPELALLAWSGNALMLDTIHAVGTDLGIGLTTIANLYGPEAFIIGGGVIDGFGELILEPARSVLAERGLPAVKNTLIRVASLGPNAAVIGAASLALTRE
jgi:glucokinase